MRHWLSNTYAVLLAALMLTSCASDDAPAPGGDVEYSRLVLSVSLPGTGPADASTRGDFDNFDNELDKWGKQGENIEELRVIILDGDGNVEANATYAGLADATYAGKYEYRVRNNDTKTVILVANESSCIVDTEAGSMPAREYFNSFPVNSYIDTVKLKAVTLTLADNADGEAGNASLRKPLPITAIHREHVATTGENETVDCEYVMHRAAVKYSFRIINKSCFDHKLEGIHINRVADREFLFPNAEYETNNLGHQVIKSYSTPAATQETDYTFKGFSLALPKYMDKNNLPAVEAIEPIYVPEGLPGEDLYKVSITLNGAPLDIWGELKWRMPGQSELTTTPMTDLPRNTHVVVNITIKDDNTMEFIADVQPYSSVKLDPYFGLERDKNGNVIIERHPDGTVDVIQNGNIVRQDMDGDNISRWFTDGSVYCYEEVLKDYIHDSSEVDYIYYFEKDRPTTVNAAGDTITGNMIIIRQKSSGGTFHGDNLPDHDHDMDDRAMFVLTKDGDFEYVEYPEGGGSPVYKRVDQFGDTIIQANGYQFRNEGDMQKYIGSYVVINKQGEEELRHYQTGAKLDWDTGLPVGGNLRSGVRARSERRKQILRLMRRANRSTFLRLR